MLKNVIPGMKTEISYSFEINCFTEIW